MGSPTLGGSRGFLASQTRAPEQPKISRADSAFRMGSRGRGAAEEESRQGASGSRHCCGHWGLVPRGQLCETVQRLLGVTPPERRRCLKGVFTPSAHQPLSLGL